jgi:hypothetical protein
MSGEGVEEKEVFFAEEVPVLWEGHGVPGQLF